MVMWQGYTVALFLLSALLMQPVWGHAGHHHGTPETPPTTNGTHTHDNEPVMWAKYGWDPVTVVHGFCMAGAFLFLFPLGAICAARKSKTHTYIQLAGCLVAAFGFIVMFLSHGIFEHFSSLHSHMGLLTFLFLTLQVVYGFIAKFKFPWSVGLTEAARRELEVGSDVPCRVTCLQLVNFPRAHSYLALSIFCLGFGTTFWGYFTALDMCGADHHEWGLWSNCRAHFFVMAVCYACGILYILSSAGQWVDKSAVYALENAILVIAGTLAVLVVSVRDDHDNKELAFVVLIAGVAGVIMYYAAERRHCLDTVGFTMILLGFVLMGRKEPSEFGTSMRFSSALLLVLVGACKLFSSLDMHGTIWSIGMFVAGTVFTGAGHEMSKRGHAHYDHGYMRFLIFLTVLAMLSFTWWFSLINFMAKFKKQNDSEDTFNELELEERVKFAKLPTSAPDSGFSIHDDD